MTNAAFDELVETFEFLDDWEDRYRHVIEMGREMAPLDAALKVAATKVQGCASQVWMVPAIEGQGPQAVFRFRGDSDALIVRGLIAILGVLYSGLSVTEVGQVDAAGALGLLGLHDHLSSQRSNGLRAMVERIRLLAAQEAG